MTEPKIRFKADDGSSFPDWEENKLGELGSFTKGASLSKSDISDDGNPFILYGELYTTYNEVAYNIKRKTQAVVDKKYYSIVGDVVIPTSGESPEEISTATCIMVPNVILAGDLNIFRSEKVDGRVISYIINHQAKDKIARIAQGKSIVHIQAKQLEKIEVSYPSDEKEQQKIADFLSNVDEVIAASEEEVANLEQQKKAVMQKIFSQEVRFKRDDGSVFSDWEEIRLGDHLIQFTDITTENNQYPALTSSRKGIFLQENYFNRQVASEDNTGYNIVPYGYFTYRHMSDDAVFHFNINYIVENGIVSTLYPVFTTDSVIDDNFLQHYLNESPSFAKYCIMQKQGGSRTYMYFKKLSAYVGYIPSLPEQQKIADFLTSYDEAITAAKQELEKWKELKKGLLQQMFV